MKNFWNDSIIFVYLCKFFHVILRDASSNLTILKMSLAYLKNKSIIAQKGTFFIQFSFHIKLVKFSLLLTTKRNGKTENIPLTTKDFCTKDAQNSFETCIQVVNFQKFESRKVNLRFLHIFFKHDTEKRMKGSESVAVKFMNSS